MTYSDLFETMTVCVEERIPELDENNEPIIDEDGRKSYKDVVVTYLVKDLPIAKADIYLVSLAILTDYEQKSLKRTPKNDAFIQAYDRVQTQSSKAFSLRTMAERIVTLYDTHCKSDFANEMFYNYDYRRWGRGRMQKVDKKRVFVSDTFDETRGFDPYVFSHAQARISLSHAGLTLLAKGFRFFLEETLRHFFQKSDPDAWYPYTDEKSKKKIVPESHYLGNRTCSEFTSAVSKLLDIFNEVYTLSPHLTEFTLATTKAVDAGHSDRVVKTAEKLAQNSAKRSYGQKSESKKPKVVSVTTTDDEGWTTTIKVVQTESVEATSSS